METGESGVPGPHDRVLAVNLTRAIRDNQVLTQALAFLEQRQTLHSLFDQNGSYNADKVLS